MTEPGEILSETKDDKGQALPVVILSAMEDLKRD